MKNNSGGIKDHKVKNKSVRVLSNIANSSQCVIQLCKARHTLAAFQKLCLIIDTPTQGLETEVIFLALLLPFINRIFYHISPSVCIYLDVFILVLGLTILSVIFFMVFPILPAFQSMDISLAVTVLYRIIVSMRQQNCESVASLIFKLFQFKRCDKQTD